MRILFLLLIVFFSACKLFAQPDADSLGHILSVQKDDTLKAKILYWLGDIYRRKNPDSTLFYAEALMHLSNNLNYQKGIADALFLKGEAFYTAFEFDSAIAYYKEAGKKYEPLNTNMELRMTRSVVNALLQAGNYNSAIAYGELAERQAIESSDTIGLIDNYNLLFTAYELTGNTKAAFATSTKAIDLAEKLNDKKRLGKCLTQIAILHERQENYPEAKKYAFRANEMLLAAGDSINANKILVIYHKVNFSSGDSLRSLAKVKEIYTWFETRNHLLALPPTALTLGEMYDNLKLYKDAIAIYEQAFLIAMETNNSLVAADILFFLGKDYFTIGEFQKALTAFRQAETICIVNNINNLLPDVYEFLARSYANTGNYKAAYFYFEVCDNMKDSIYTVEECTVRIFPSVNITEPIQDFCLKSIIFLHRQNMAQ